MKFQTKMILTFPPIVMAAILVLGGWHYVESRNALYKQTYRYLELYLNETISNDLKRRHLLLAEAKMDQIDFFVREYQAEAISALAIRKKELEGDFLILDNNDKVIFSTGSKNNVLNNLHWKSAANRLSEGQKNFTSGYLENQKNHYLYVGSYFRPWKWKIFYSLEENQILQAISQTFWRTAISMALCLLFAIALIIWILNRFLVRKILILKEAAVQIAEQQPIELINIQSNDELGGLARNMETMSAKLQQHKKRQEDLQKELELVNEELKASNERLALLNQELEQKVAKRTTVLENVNINLRAQQQNLNAQLESATKRRNELVSKVSELALKKADVIQYNVKIMEQLRASMDENLFLREQIKTYSEMLERTHQGIDRFGIE